MKIWLTEDGDYSSRTVTGVFSTEELANAFGGDVTELELDEGVDIYRQGYKHYSVLFNKAGDVQEVRFFRPAFTKQEYTGKHYDWTDGCFPHKTTAVYCQLVAKNEDGAIKRASEMLAQFMYEGKWVD